MSNYSSETTAPISDRVERLRVWMARSGKTQVAMAAQLGVSQSRVSRILAGDVTLRSKTLRRWWRLAELKPISVKRSPEKRLGEAVRLLSRRDPDFAVALAVVLNEVAGSRHSRRTRSKR